MEKIASHSRWIYMIIALVVSFLFFCAWSIHRASTGGSAVADRNYYSRGLEHGRILEERDAAEAMGWTLSANLVAGRLEIRLLDLSGRPVSGCKGEALLAGDSRLTLLETEPGLYCAGPLPDLRGEIPARLELARDGARIDRKLQLNL